VNLGPDLDCLLDHVVDYECAKDELARHDEVVKVSHVANQLHRLERGGGDDAPGSGELKHDPETMCRL
jgi:hypothetical protein